jgi:hypothetical protein
MATHKRTIGILTGGGDVPGLNPALRAATFRAIHEGYQVLGIRRGWAGLVDLVRDEDAMQNARFSVGSDLMRFRKSLHTLEGVVAEVGGRAEIDKVLCTEYVRQFAVEWPQRCLHPPQFRDFTKRLWNLDLIHTLLRYPATIARFWTGHAADMLETYIGSPGTDVPSAKPAIRVDAAASWEPGPNMPPETT